MSTTLEIERVPSKWTVDKKGNLELKKDWKWAGSSCADLVRDEKTGKEKFVKPKTLKFDKAKALVFAIGVPINEPMNIGWKPEKNEKGEIVKHGLGSIFTEAFKQNDLMHNYIISEFYKGEPSKLTHDQKYEPLEREDFNALNNRIYQDCSKTFKGLTSGTIASTLQAVQKTFKKERFKVFQGKVSRKRYKEGQPIRFRKADLILKKLAMFGSHAYVLDLPIVQGSKNNRIQLRIAGGKRFGRENGILEDIIEGYAELCEASLIREPISKGSREKSFKGTGWRLKLVVKKLPKTVKKTDKLLTITTDKDTLLALWVGGQKFQVYHGDNLNRWQKEEERISKLCVDRREKIHRLNDDRKFERRSGETPKFEARSQKYSQKYNNRMDNEVKQLAAMVRKHATRRGCDEVVLIDGERKLDGYFQWFKLELQLENTLKFHGIKFSKSDASGEVVAKTA